MDILEVLESFDGAKHSLHIEYISVSVPVILGSLHISQFEYIYRNIFRVTWYIVRQMLLSMAINLFLRSKGQSGK